MDINMIWNAIEPWVTVVLAALSAAVSIILTAKTWLGKWNVRLMERYNTNDVASKVAEQLSGKTLNIDVTAVAEKKLDKIEQKLNKKVEAIYETISTYSRILAQIGAGVAKFKSLTAEERQALIDSVKALDSGYTPPEPEQVITVKLEPISVTPPESEPVEEDASIINFGALGK